MGTRFSWKNISNKTQILRWQGATPRQQQSWTTVSQRNHLEFNSYLLHFLLILTLENNCCVSIIFWLWHSYAIKLCCLWKQKYMGKYFNDHSKLSSFYFLIMTVQFVFKWGFLFFSFSFILTFDDNVLSKEV